MKIRVALLAFPITLAAQPSADPGRGQKLYQNHCSLCHGQTGLGGKGPSLARPKLPRAPDLDTLTEVIQRGIRGTEMPGAWQLTDNEAMDVARYVLTLGRTEIVQLPGDPARGREIYAKKGCASCHIIHGAGSSFGPELTEIGARRNPDYLREAVVKPAATVPPAYLVVKVTPRDGKPIRGIRVNEDSFTIQLRDASNHFHSFRKHDLSAIDKQFDQSLMPPFDSLSASELDDLIAYLASLRGDS